MKNKYRDWCSKNSFESMIPDDVKTRKANALAKQKQDTLDGHLHERPPAPHIVRYTDALFRQVAIEWLIETGQVSARAKFSG